MAQLKSKKCKIILKQKKVCQIGTLTIFLYKGKFSFIEMASKTFLN